MALLHEADRIAVRARLAGLARPVRLLVFISKAACAYCDETRHLAEELAALSDKVRAEVYVLEEAPEVARRYGIERVPAIVLLPDEVGAADPGLRFFGIPAGYEFATLLDDLFAVAGQGQSLAPATLAWLEQLDRPLHLQVFVTPTCPYCPRAALLAHRLAVASPLVRADVVEAMEFPELAERYQVFGVPRTVINETVAVEGAVPELLLLAKLKEVVTAPAAG